MTGTSRTLPHAASVAMAGGRPIYGDRDTLRRIAAERGLAGLANNTKWNELLDAMRAKAGWRPSYRTKLIVSDHVSGWDSEWFYHPPFPMLSIEWIDIGRFEKRLVGGRRTDVEHGPELESLVGGIGLDHVVGAEAIRVFGYSPRDMRQFEAE